MQGTCNANSVRLMPRMCSVFVLLVVILVLVVLALFVVRRRLRRLLHRRIVELVAALLHSAAGERGIAVLLAAGHAKDGRHESHE